MAVEPPSVPVTFSNAFWGREDAGVAPLLGRMHSAKVTGDELKSFYGTRAAIEDEYARKLMNLARKPLGSSESGTLRMSLDVVRGEVEAMAKAHQGIAGQMKSELEEPLSAFAGGLKERRKIVQSGIEKLLKVKMQQAATVNKSRDRFEQDCLKIKGYLAQGHMVMGQEERRNKAKLEKTQIQLSNTSNEYEAAVKMLEETTGRWNRDWKAACDKFQDLEEERIDFMKSSLWSFANIASTVCVSDDAACEKIRLSLEDCDVEKDILSFIKDNGTGQEIPDPPKFIDFCRGDAEDQASEVDGGGNYSVAQFQRPLNPSFRGSSPQPSIFESHNDPDSDLAKDLRTSIGAGGPEAHIHAPAPSRQQGYQHPTVAEFGDIPQVPHNPYPQDGMTQFTRMAPPSDRGSSVASPVRPISRDSHSQVSDLHSHVSEYSNPTSVSSYDPQSGAQSPVKQVAAMFEQEPSTPGKKKGFWGNSPFRRRSKYGKDEMQQPAAPANNRNTWAPGRSPEKRGTILPGRGPSPTPEPVDPRASFQLNVGQNVFDVASPDSRGPGGRSPVDPDEDPIAAALAELKGVAGLGKGTPAHLDRTSIDRYHGLATPAPRTNSSTPQPGAPAPPGAIPTALSAAQRGTPPPSYEKPGSRLGAPRPAHTAKQMQQTTEKYTNQKRDMFNSPNKAATWGQPGTPQARPGGMSRSASPAPLRATSPNPMRAASPQPPHPTNGAGFQGRTPLQSRPNQPGPTGSYNRNSPYANSRENSPNMPRPSSRANGPAGQGAFRGSQAGPNPSGVSPGQSPYGRPVQQPAPLRPEQARQQHQTAPLRAEPRQQMHRSASPQPPQAQFQRGPPSRPGSSMGVPMAVQLAATEGGTPGHGQRPGTVRGRSGTVNQRPQSSYYANEGAGAGGAPGERVRSKSVVALRQGEFAKDGKTVLSYARALYMYQAAIPEELSFSKGDILAITRMQDDGWWEAEIVSRPGKVGLVPSNYLQNC